MKNATKIAQALAEGGALNNRDRGAAARMIARMGNDKATNVATALANGRLILWGDLREAAQIIGTARRAL